MKSKPEIQTGTPIQFGRKDKGWKMIWEDDLGHPFTHLSGTSANHPLGPIQSADPQSDPGHPVAYPEG
jgi:hypothetical protein